jgi:hypothetical protein
VEVERIKFHFLKFGGLSAKEVAIGRTKRILPKMKAEDSHIFPFQFEGPNR